MAKAPEQTPEYVMGVDLARGPSVAAISALDRPTVTFLGLDYWTQPTPAPAPWPHDVDNADILQSIDVLLEHNASNPLAPILARLPIAEPEGDQTIRFIGGPRATERCRRPLNNQEARDWGLYIGDPTHHYVEKSATWNGLTLRWYEWEDRKVTAERRQRQHIGTLLGFRLPFTAEQEEEITQAIRVGVERFEEIRRGPDANP